MQIDRPLPFAPLAPPKGGPSALESTALAFGGLIKQAMARGDGAMVAQLTEMLMLNSSARLGSGHSPSPGLPHYLRVYQSVAAAGRKSTPAPAVTAGSSAAQASKPPSVGKMTISANIMAADPTAQRREFDEIIDQEAARHQLPAHLVRAVVTAESDYDPACVSKAGAMGLMQLMPETAGDLGVTDPFDPAQNIKGGVRYLAMMLKRFDGELDKALAAYNFGPSNVEAGRALPRRNPRLRGQGDQTL